MQAEKLAIEGGRPLRSAWLPYARQTIEEADISAVSESLRSDFITRGPKVKAFEEALAEYCEMPFVVAFNSATAALHATMSLLGVKKVVVPPITFAATANAVLYCGGELQFCDVSAQDLNIDPDCLKAMKLSDVSAVTAVDFAGRACDYPKLRELLPKSTVLVSDAAHSFGGKLSGRPVGSLADISIFSFHPAKSLTTGEGGCVLVRDAAQAEYLRTFRNHGISFEKRPGFSTQDFLGYNYHLTEMQAALGLEQLSRLAKFIQRRNEIASQYNEYFSKNNLVQIPLSNSKTESAWHLYALRLNLDDLTKDRDYVLEALRAENIGAQVHYIPVYWHPYYQKLGFKKGICPVAEREYKRELSLPIFPGMSDKDVQDVCRAMDKILSKLAKS